MSGAQIIDRNEKFRRTSLRWFRTHNDVHWRSRRTKKLAARKMREKRRELVHAAGCVFDRCIVRLTVMSDVELVNEARSDGVRIPRSLIRRLA